MSNTLSVYRRENKYILPSSDISNLKFCLDKVLQRDKHSIKNSYVVRSLYFDSLNNIDFDTKLAGVEVRKKIRLRTYDSKHDKCKLELKQKKGDLQHKISIWISKEDAKELINKNYSVLLKYSDNEDAILFYTTMASGCYTPVALIEYDRIAYTYPLNNTRITIDMNVRSNESNFDLFAENPIYNYVIGNDIILEVKYDGQLLKFISNLLNKYNLNRISVSKYCFGRKVFYDFDY